MDSASMRPINPKFSVLSGKDDGRRFLTGEFGEVNDNAPPRPEQPPFQSTREDRRFAEFARSEEHTSELQSH